MSDDNRRDGKLRTSATDMGGLGKLMPKRQRNYIQQARMNRRQEERREETQQIFPTDEVQLPAVPCHPSQQTATPVQQRVLSRKAPPSPSPQLLESAPFLVPRTFQQAAEEQPADWQSGVQSPHQSTASASARVHRRRMEQVAQEHSRGRASRVKSCRKSRQEEATVPSEEWSQEEATAHMGVRVTVKAMQEPVRLIVRETSGSRTKGRVVFDRAIKPRATPTESVEDESVDVVFDAENYKGREGEGTKSKSYLKAKSPRKVIPKQKSEAVTDERVSSVLKTTAKLTSKPKQKESVGHQMDVKERTTPGIEIEKTIPGMELEKTPPEDKLTPKPTETPKRVPKAVRPKKKLDQKRRESSKTILEKWGEFTRSVGSLLIETAEEDDEPTEDQEVEEYKEEEETGVEDKPIDEEEPEDVEIEEEADTQQDGQGDNEEGDAEGQQQGDSKIPEAMEEENPKEGEHEEREEEGVKTEAEEEKPEEGEAAETEVKEEESEVEDAEKEGNEEKREVGEAVKKENKDDASPKVKESAKAGEKPITKQDTEQVKEEEVKQEEDKGLEPEGKERKPKEEEETVETEVKEEAKENQNSQRNENQEKPEAEEDHNREKEEDENNAKGEKEEHEDTQIAEEDDEEFENKEDQEEEDDEGVEENEEDPEE